MKLKEVIKGNYTNYYRLDGTLKYQYSKGSKGYESWREYDKQGNEIHFKDSKGYERWSEYDKQGNEVHYKNSDGYEQWRKYDKQGNEIYYKNSKGYEWWGEYDNPEKKKELVNEKDIKVFKFGKV